MRFFWAFAWLIIGAFFALLLLIPLSETMPLRQVVTCRSEREYDHRWARLKFADGTADSVEIYELNADCFAPGTRIEKRRWELGHRIDGAEPRVLDGHAWWSLAAVYFCAAAAALAFVLGFLRRR